jgi:hypothetical protein
LPLTGLEQRGCWQERRPATHAQAADADPDETPRAHRVPLTSHEGWAQPGRDFIPVELLGQIVVGPERDATGGPGESTPSPLPLIAADADESWAERTSLFGDAEA